LGRRALVVGINHYDHYGPEMQLYGAIPDANAVAELLSRHNNGDPNYDCITLTSGPGDPITRARLRAALAQLFRGTNDDVLFYFSGHGTVTSTGGYIVTQDANHSEIGVSMDELLTLANQAHENESIIILDSCMSGAMGNPQLLQGNGPYQNSLLGQNVSILAASRHNEESYEEAGHGLFTSLLIDALDGLAANLLGNITLPAIYAHIEGSLGPWNQRPIYKTYTSKVNIVRRADPPISLPRLRLLTELFPEPDTLYQLSPEYEYDREPTTEKQKVGQLFKRYRDAGLVGAEEEGKDFFWVAHDSGNLKLTRLGRHFWSLINDGRV
jgi:hypothetical protein